jgi:hypothetical protein
MACVQVSNETRLFDILSSQSGFTKWRGIIERQLVTARGMFADQTHISFASLDSAFVLAESLDLRIYFKIILFVLSIMTDNERFKASLSSAKILNANICEVILRSTEFS